MISDCLLSKGTTRLLWYLKALAHHPSVDNAHTKDLKWENPTASKKNQQNRILMWGFDVKKQIVMMMILKPLILFLFFFWKGTIDFVIGD